MATKTFKGRIQNKHDTEANWKVATNFKPLAGELIIYDKDNTHSTPRFKVGDGSTLVSNLPFVNGTMKFGTDSFSYEDGAGNIGTFGPMSIELNNSTYKAVYDTTSIGYKNISTDVAYDLNFPTKSGTFALTSDIDVTAAGDNIFTGTNTFKTETSDNLFRTLIDQNGISVGGGPAASGILIDVTYGLDNIKRLYGGNTYTYSFPNKNGIFATMNDIPNVAPLAKLAQDNTFTGKNLINTDPEHVGGYDRYKTIDFSNYDSIKVGWKKSNTFDSDWYSYTRYADGAIYRSPTGLDEVSYLLPTKSGTVALTSDLPVANSGTGTTTLTSLKIDDTIYTIPSGDVTAAGNNTFTGMTNTFTNQVNLQGLVRIGSGNSITNLSSNSTTLINVNLPSKAGTLALTNDIPIKTATLSGTTLSITLS